MTVAIKTVTVCACVVSQVSQEEDDDDPDKVEDEEASATEEELPKKTGRRTTRGTSDTIPTGKSTSGMSIKLLCKTPCLPINIIVKPGK